MEDELQVTSDITDVATQLLASYQKALDASRASGQLQDSAKTTVEYDGRYFCVYFEIQDYWKYVENGTRPHWPPIDAIEQWIRVKRLVPKAVGGKVPTTRQLAFLISRKISKVGTEGTKALQESINGDEALIDQMVDFITDQMDKEIDKELEQAVE